MEKGIKILDPKRFMLTQTKWNYDKHIKRMENQNDIDVEKDWASKARFVPFVFDGVGSTNAQCNVGIF